MNYLVAQTVLAERLRALLPASLPVKTAVDFAQVKDQAVGQPEVWVFFHRDRVIDTSGEQTRIEQDWAAMYLTPGILPDIARDGAALFAMTKALVGYDAGMDGMSAFKRTGSLVPQSFESLTGYGMLFSVTLDM